MNAANVYSVIIPGANFTTDFLETAVEAVKESCSAHAHIYSVGRFVGWNNNGTVEVAIDATSAEADYIRAHGC